MDAINHKRKAKRKDSPVSDCLLQSTNNIDKKYPEKPSIYAGSEEKLLNLVEEIIVKIILKEVL